jgi:Fe-S-cluster containining protein
VGEEDDLPAGEFSAWLHSTLLALTTDAGAEVPCGTCTACCRSSYFIHIEPDETETLRRIPRSLLFAAPGLPEGNVVMGYDARGHCPMLVDDRCSIYEHRPRTCRAYDCRVFPAAGLSPDDDSKPLITERVRRWRFDHPTERDVDEHDAVRSAAVSIRQGSAPPSTAIGLAIAAIKAQDRSRPCD